VSLSVATQGRSVTQERSTCGEETDERIEAKPLPNNSISPRTKGSRLRRRLTRIRIQNGLEETKKKKRNAPLHRNISEIRYYRRGDCVTVFTITVPRLRYSNSNISRQQTRWNGSPPTQSIHKFDCIFKFVAPPPLSLSLFGVTRITKETTSTRSLQFL